MSIASEFIFNTLPSWLEYFVEYVGSIVSSMMMTPNEAIALAIQELPEGIASVLEGISFTGVFWETPLLFWFFGVGLSSYLIYQFIIWILNIIT